MVVYAEKIREDVLAAAAAGEKEGVEQ